MAIHNPRLDTILRVESLLKESEKPISKNDIQRKSKKSIMRSTLNTILNYLEESDKIKKTKQGYIWIKRKEKSEIKEEIQEEAENTKSMNDIIKDLEKTSKELEEANKVLKEKDK